MEVGGRLLMVLAARRSALALKELAEQAGLSAARAHPYLVSFGRLGLVEQQQPSGHYALGPGALQLGLSALAQLDAMRLGEAVAERLAAQTGLAVAVAAWGNFGPTIVRLFEARQPLLISMRAGTVMSVLGTATGRAFSATLPLHRVALALGAGTGTERGGAMGDPPREAPVLGAEELAVIESARRDLRLHGVVRAKGRPIPGINAFSAPALDHESRPALVITALGHEAQVPVDWHSPTARAVREAAQEVSHRLGWQAASP